MIRHPERLELVKRGAYLQDYDDKHIRYEKDHKSIHPSFEMRPHQLLDHLQARCPSDTCGKMAFPFSATVTSWQPAMFH